MKKLILFFNRFKHNFSYVLLGYLLFCIFVVTSAKGEDYQKAAIIVSREIKPYFEALEGIDDEFSNYSNITFEVFFLEKFQGKSITALKNNLNNSEFGIFVGIGPEALKFLWIDNEIKKPIIFSMVLHPEKIMGDKSCGIPLSLPIDILIKDIKQSLPSIKNIGLLFDSLNNDDFFQSASKYSQTFSINIIPLRVSSKKDIPSVLKSHWKDIDGIWMIPDSTTISESIIQYLIKESLLKKKIVIGYNKFFFESGSALAFVFDYKAIGIQTAKYASHILFAEDTKCEKKNPHYRIHLNENLLKKLGIIYIDKNNE
ncbi:MAG: hypothetical protein HQK76_11670 [Desulfobacterales bacterium]|nr:hypothetical protein [Desulfobacterales bacterium]